MIASADQLRKELRPNGALEEMFFSQIVNLSTLASFLMKHIEADPDLAHKETPRRMRLLTANLRQSRYAYEELRRLQLARFLQETYPELADTPVLAIVATNTTRNGLRTMRRPAAVAAPSTPAIRPATPGRNAACPCNSGLKYKHCCANKQLAA